MQHRYLFTLEVTPLTVGKTYDELPSHLTLMSRFLTVQSADDISRLVKPLFAATPQLELSFGDTIQLGPKKLIVHEVTQPAEIQLHIALKELLDTVDDLTYEYPEFIGKHHRPHVTKREQAYFQKGDTCIAKAAYLIEVVDKQRIVRNKFSLLAILK
jgi:hypothetical protein